MPTTTSTVTDSYGDDLAVSTYSAIDDRIYVTITEGTDDDQSVALVALRPEQATEAASNLLKAAGQQIVPVSSLKLGGEISFNEAVLRVAALHKRTVTFRYAKDGGEYIEARRLNPEKIVGEHDKLAAVGTDPDREDYRRYRLDRIKGEVSFA